MAHYAYKRRGVQCLIERSIDKSAARRWFARAVRGVPRPEV
jgi:hypothetical protein